MHGKENSSTEEKGKSRVIGTAALAALLTQFPLSVLQLKIKGL
jgi:hypothetical protein